VKAVLLYASESWTVIQRVVSRKYKYSSTNVYKEFWINTDETEIATRSYGGKLIRSQYCAS